MRLDVEVATPCLFLAVMIAMTASGQEVMLGPEVVASVNEDGGLLRVEPAVVLADSVVVVAWNDSRAGRDYGVRIGVQVGWAYSVDYGRTFRFGGYVPDPERVNSPAGADSWLAYDGRETIYLQILHWPDEGDHEIRVYAIPATRPDRIELLGIAARGSGVDKPAMTLGPHGDLWIVYTDRSRIFAVVSRDRGRTWSSPTLVSLDTPGKLRTGADVAVCGRHVVAAWVEEGRGTGADAMEDSHSAAIWTAVADTASGGVFDAQTRAHSLSGPLPVPPGYSLGLGQMGHIANLAYLACHPRTERLSLVAAEPVEDAAGSNQRGSRAIVLHADAAKPLLDWRGPRAVSRDAGRFMVFPAIETTAHGTAIAYYDWRHARDLVGTDVYLTLESRESEVRDLRITDVSTPWPDLPGDPEHAPIQRNAGDYLALAGQQRRFVVAWTDGRTGRSMIMTRLVEFR